MRVVAHPYPLETSQEVMRAALGTGRVLLIGEGRQYLGGATAMLCEVELVVLAAVSDQGEAMYDTIMEESRPGRDLKIASTNPNRVLSLAAPQLRVMPVPHLLSSCA